MLIDSKGLIVDTLSVSYWLPIILKLYGHIGIIEFDEIFKIYSTLLFPVSSSASWMFDIGKSMEMSKIFWPILFSGLLIILKVTVSVFKIPGINLE